MCVCARARAPSRYWARTDMYRYTIENVRIAVEMVRIAVETGKNIAEMALHSVEFALMRQAIGVAQRQPQFVALPLRLQKQMAAILDVGAQKPKGLNKPQANARGGRRIVAPQRPVAVWRCGCVGRCVGRYCGRECE